MALRPFGTGLRVFASVGNSSLVGRQNRVADADWPLFGNPRRGHNSLPPGIEWRQPMPPGRPGGRTGITAMPYSTRGDRVLITPDERLGVLPASPVATSSPLGWSALRVERFRDTPDFDLDLPGQTHHLLSLYLRPPERMGLWCEGLEWEATPPPGSILILPAGHARRAFWRGPTDSIHVHLDPRLISRVAAEACDLDPDRVELPAVEP